MILFPILAVSYSGCPEDEKLLAPRRRVGKLLVKFDNISPEGQTLDAYHSVDGRQKFPPGCSLGRVGDVQSHLSPATFKR